MAAIGRTLLAVVPWLGALALPLAAQQAAGGNNVAAEVLAVPCFTCHGEGGNSPGAIPSLNRLDPAELLQKMKAFRDGDPNSTIMTRIARGYSDAELAAISGYLSALH